MHEMSLAEGVMQIVEDSARREGFASVRAVRLEIGELAGVEIDALRFCFDVVARGTVAEGAALDIVRVPGEGRCLDCGATALLKERFDACPLCGGTNVKMTSGDELRVAELEVV